MNRILNSIQSKTDQSELFELDSTVNLVNFENGRLKNINTLNSHGAAIRAISKGKLGQATISDFRRPDEIAGKVKKLAELGDPVAYEFNSPAQYEELNLIDPSVEKLTTAHIIDQGQEAVDMIKAYDPHVTAEFIAERTREHVSLLTSHGIKASYDRMYFSYGVMAELIEQQNILRLGKFSKGLKFSTPPTTAVHALLDDLKTGRKTVTFKPGKMPILLAPGSLSDVLMAFTGAVNGDMVAKAVSPLTNRMNEKILDPRISIWDDPWHENGIMSAPFDDEGTPTHKRPVIEKGVLKSFLSDLKSAASLKSASTGNGYRSVPFELFKSYSAGVAADFSNLIMSPGEIQLKKLRESISYGVEIHQINGILLGDLIGGDFSGSLEVAFLIENGERTGRIKDAMVAGNFFTLFKDQVRDLSVEQEWSGIFGGGSGSLYLPWVCIDGVDVSGN